MPANSHQGEVLGHNCDVCDARGRCEVRGVNVVREGYLTVMREADVKYTPVRSMVVVGSASCHLHLFVACHAAP